MELYVKGWWYCKGYNLYVYEALKEEKVLIGNELVGILSETEKAIKIATICLQGHCKRIITYWVPKSVIVEMNNVKYITWEDCLEERKYQQEVFNSFC